jgi:hypothetical protein
MSELKLQKDEYDDLATRLMQSEPPERGAMTDALTWWLLACGMPVEAAEQLAQRMARVAGPETGRLTARWLVSGGLAAEWSSILLKLPLEIRMELSLSGAMCDLDSPPDTHMELSFPGARCELDWEERYRAASADALGWWMTTQGLAQELAGLALAEGDGGLSELTMLYLRWYLLDVGITDDE